MLSFVLRRLAVMAPTLVLVSMLVFSLQKLLPGDPVLAMAGEDRDPAVIAQLRERYGFNDPVPVQYLHWARQVAHGDLGMSLRTHQTVAALLAEKLPPTIELAILSLLVALVVGIPAGIASAVRKGTMTDHVANVVALSGLSIPHFWLGILLILLFSVTLRWLPAVGYVPFAGDPAGNLIAMIMPAVVVGGGLAAVLMRHTRSAMLGVLNSDYVRTARAKGLLFRAVILRHAFRNALFPIVTMSTLLFGELLGGAVLTEQVFTIPGFGKLMVDAVFNRDYAVVQGVVLCVAAAFLLLNLAADVVYMLINPRLRRPR
ncbi:ABC transporter permease [Telmatospirillum siberiense]|uniref:Peptide ABC transporter n=1 Tax=Telmatospirillum siberiense TaxID=382514 RepID=A0A2N3PN34_9PROT|nr:ABC transporter permease [Telmatospirillum siberiense]PKU21811.1 peptide ABC transporter [Telmatospirillum siberiense]